MNFSFFPVDKATFMVGSYGPRPEEYEFLTPIEEAPKGMLARGTYHNKSFFTDDDKHDHLTWEWNLSIKKDWTEWVPQPFALPIFAIQKSPWSLLPDHSWGPFPAPSTLLALHPFPHGVSQW